MTGDASLIGRYEDKADMHFLFDKPLNVIRLWEPESECCICGMVGVLRHAVAYCCGPTRDEIGSMSTEYPGTEVGGMPACKACHDRHYSMPASQ